MFTISCISDTVIPQNPVSASQCYLVLTAYLTEPQKGLQSGHKRTASLTDHLFHFHPNGYQIKIPLRKKGPESISNLNKRINSSRVLSPLVLGPKLLCSEQTTYERSESFKTPQNLEMLFLRTTAQLSTLSAGIQRVEIHRNCELTSGFRGRAHQII